jgi:hypothetical protein
LAAEKNRQVFIESIENPDTVFDFFYQKNQKLPPFLCELKQTMQCIYIFTEGVKRSGKMSEKTFCRLLFISNW